MIEFDAERYQDSAQGRASVRDRWGNDKPNPADYDHNYHDPMDAAARAERNEVERVRLQKLRVNIQRCMAQMELICPPKGGAA